MLLRILLKLKHLHLHQKEQMLNFPLYFEIHDILKASKGLSME